MSPKCGNVSGPASSKPLPTSKHSWPPCNSWNPSTPRDAFCRGRTNAIKLYHHVTPNQKIHYIDYTSLYRWANKTCIYPITIVQSVRVQICRNRDKSRKSTKLGRNLVYHITNHLRGVPRISSPGGRGRGVFVLESDFPLMTIHKL